MGSINYLVNHKQKKIFVLGKMLSGYDIAKIKNENDLLEYLKKQFQSEWFNIPNSDEYAEILVRSIINSIGLDDNVNMNDYSNDELYTTCSDYIVVGSFYLNDVGVGKPFYIKNTKWYNVCYSSEYKQFYVNWYNDETTALKCKTKDYLETRSIEIEE